MFPQNHPNGIAVGVLGNVGTAFLYNSKQTVFDGACQFCIRKIILQLYLKGRRECAQTFPDGGLQGNRLIVQIMHTAANAGHSLIERLDQLFQLIALRGFGSENLQGAHLQNGTSQQMSDIVMNFPCNAVSFFEHCQIDFIILCCNERLIFGFEQQLLFCGMITGFMQQVGDLFQGGGSMIQESSCAEAAGNQ